MLRVRLVLLLSLMVACSAGRVDSAGQSSSTDSTPVSREAIPAEWTISEDTSETGDITTASLQLPASKDIAGLLQDEAPRLLLRCLDGKIAVFIDTGSLESDSEADSAATSEPVRVQLDAAPTCE